MLDTISVEDTSEVIVVEDIAELVVNMMGTVDMIDGGDTVVLSNGSTISTHSLISSINNVTLLLSTIVILNTSWALVLVTFAGGDS